MTQTTLPATPYKGLTAYDEDDAPFFFGREAECEIITANLLATRLTLLYGASGVGKSSVLRAGAAHHIRQLSQQNVVEFGTPKLAVVVCDAWRDDPVAGLVARIENAVVQAWNDRPVDPVRPERPLAQTLHAWTERVDGTLLIILDQFEEYFLYHAQEDGDGTFAREFAHAVNRVDVRAHFLIALREDALAQLDRFKGRIPNLFDNYLRIEHLGPEAARAAIERPLAYYNQVHAAGGVQVSIESALVDEVLAQVKTGQVVLDNAGRGVVGSGIGPRRVETPYLQLVLTRLWDEEMRAGSHVLRLATLEDLGGAQNIVRTHLDTAMGARPPHEQDVAARVFRYLVTPSGTKIAYTVDDLAAYADVPQQELTSVLQHLASGTTRILRPVVPPPDQPATPRYEIFHDVLAAAILDWRARYVQAQQEREERDRRQRELQRAQETAAEQKRQAETERRRAEEQAGYARRLRRRSILLAVVSLVAVGAAVVAASAQQQATFQAQTAVAERNRANQQARLATAGALAGRALAHLDDQFDLALLLAVEATNLADTTEAKGSLLTALQSNLHLITYLNGRARSGEVENVAFSPDGKTLAAGRDDGTVRLWDVATHRPLGRPLTGHKSAVTSVTFSPDGKLLAAGSWDRTIILWASTTHRPLGPPLTGDRGARGTVSTVAFSPNGQTLASGNWGGTVILWDVATHRRIAAPLNGHQRAIYTVAFSPDGKTLASGGWDRTVILWNVAAHQRIGQPLIGHGAAVTGVAFSPSGKALASGSNDGTIRLWDVARQQPLAPPLTGHVGPATSVAFSPDDKVVASGGVDGKTILWDFVGHQRVGHILTSVTSRVHSVAFSPDGRTLAFGGDDRRIHLWDVTTHTPLAPPLAGHTAAVYAVAISPDGKTLASGSADGTLRLWDVRSHRPRGRPMTGHLDTVRSVAFSPDGKLVASGNWDRTVTLWDVATHQLVGPPLTGHTNTVWSVAFSPDGKTLASAGYDKTIILWAVAPYRRLGRSLTDHRVPMVHLLRRLGVPLVICLQPPIGRLATASGRHSSCQDELVFSVAFSPDGKTLASSSWDRTIMLWDVKTHRPLGRPLTGHTDSALSVDFSPDGTMLASGGQDKTIILWDVATHQRIGLPLTGPTGAVYSVAFSPDDRTLASGGADGTIWLWDPNVVSWQRRACSIANRNLTMDEWNLYIGKDIPYERTCPNLPTGG